MPAHAAPEPVRTLSRRRWALLLTGLLLAPFCPAQAQPEPALQLKAQILLKTLRFVEWPAGAVSGGQVLQVCVLDDASLGPALAALPPGDGSGVQVRQVRPRQLTGCHVAVFGNAHDGAGVAPGILLVGDAPGMLDRGMMLNFQVEDGRVVFDVDLDATRRGGLEISAKLLRLARFVRRR